MMGNRLLIVALTLGVNACSYSTDVSINPEQPPATVPVEGVKVTPQVMQFFTIGESRQVSATIAPLDATDKALTWESTDTTVATVDAHGLVTAKATGVGVFVTAYTHDGHHQASVNVSVNP